MNNVDNGEKKITPDDLSGAGCFALTYAMALVNGPDSPEMIRWRSGAAHLDRVGMSFHDRRQNLQRGLSELLAIGVIGAERDGEGVWVPTTVHYDRLSVSLRTLLSS